MRCIFLSNLTVAGTCVAAVATSFADGKPRKVNKSFFGTWRSDKEKTVENWCYNKPIVDAAREKFESIFGKLRWRITEARVYSEFEDQKSSYAYTVLASNERSVVVSHRSDGEPELKQYFFEDQYL